MKTHTVTTVLDAPKDPRLRLPVEGREPPGMGRSEFARELRYEEGKAKVVNGLGEFYFSIDGRPRKRA